jgi:hypothetical protein
MTIDYLEKQLEKWQRLLSLFLGAAATLAASMLGIAGEDSVSYGWFMCWIVVQLGAAPAGLLLLAGKEWRKLPLPQRLNTAFGYLAVVWLCWLAVGLKIIDQDFSGFAFILVIGAVLSAFYLLLRRTRTNAPEEMFP